MLGVCLYFCSIEEFAENKLEARSKYEKLAITHAFYSALIVFHAQGLSIFITLISSILFNNALLNWFMFEIPNNLLLFM
jgi:hypothetical protein